ncbi:MAG TPA: 3-deoxy-D-manno-octulosonic acid kinase [Gammaproteobacteria bacterium]|nr:3-deoxy-D-manno-octulosonic acid kinase [Gammaproteobacteria bacterium]
MQSGERQGPGYVPTGRGAVVHDPALLPRPGPEIFSAEHWRQHGHVHSPPAGRGCVWFVGESGAWVLRHYRRGGLVARLVRDHYLWTGLKRTRAWREWHLLYDLHARDLPVPRPVAARVERRGCSYRADIITERLPGEPLSALLARGAVSLESWHAIGRAIAGLHAGGLWHADLNAHNILLSPAGGIAVIDLDRARLRRAGGRWRRRNLARLRRSLDKLRRQDPVLAFNERDWEALRSGYGEAAADPSLRRRHPGSPADGA